MNWQDLVDDTVRNSVSPLMGMNDLEIPRRLRPVQSTRELTETDAFNTTRVVLERQSLKEKTDLLFEYVESMVSVNGEDAPVWAAVQPSYVTGAHAHQTVWMLCSFLLKVGPVNMVIAAYDPIVFRNERYISYWLPTSITKSGFPLLIFVEQKGATEAHRKYREFALPLLSQR